MMKFMFGLIFLLFSSFNMSFWVVCWFLFFFSFIFMFLFLSNNFMELSYMLGCDFLSFALILLSFWICSLMLLASGKIYLFKNYNLFFSMILLFLLFSLFMTFSSLNLFIFYLFFEISLIPTLILIIGWGYQPERLEAGIYLLFYTLFMSLPMMIMIFYLFNNLGSMFFMFLSNNLNYMFMYFCINLVFFVKIPMFMLHLWLPKAHVEAPVSGSMILAGIMLKLGGYGLLRMLILFKYFVNSLNILLISLSLIGGIFVSFICIRQSDMKSLIAYSSVSHMSLVLSSLLTLNYWGMSGALVMMLAHGLCSSGLFCLSNLMYERLSSRSLYLNKGLLSIIPSFSMWWFLLLSSNMAAPPSMNLVGEIMIINSIVSFQSLNMILLSFLSFFSAVYSLFLYSYTQHGKIYSSVLNFSNSVNREFLLLLLHWLPLNLLFLNLKMFI